jgi:hypothetical protein
MGGVLSRCFENCYDLLEGPADYVQIQVQDPLSAAQYREQLQDVVEQENRSRSEFMLQILSTALAGASPAMTTAQKVQEVLTAFRNIATVAARRSNHDLLPKHELVRSDLSDLRDSCPFLSVSRLVRQTAVLRRWHSFSTTT